ncbi:MAG: M23 family metallopeptidase [Acidiferrobacterales bacterium]|nr:M23 family metallopeptidase [Acidiferrobacterales bacterium]
MSGISSAVVALFALWLPLAFSPAGAEIRSDASTGASLDGSFTQGGLIIGTTRPGAKVVFNGNPVRVSGQGKFLIGFGRDAKPLWPLVIEYPDGQLFTSEVEISKREYDIQRIDGLAPSMVTPSEEDLERIVQETALINKARKIDDERTDFLEPFDWPVHGIITGVYGSQRILNGEPRRPHYGIDIAVPADTPVRAPASGIVTVAHPDMYFSGGTVIIDHGHGLSSAFLHLGGILVTEGEHVKKGQPFATVGSSGRSTGAHLDWRINLFSSRLDVGLLVGEMPPLD